MTASQKDLLQRGYSRDDIHLATIQQEATRRAGGRPRTLAEILAGQQARPRPSATPDDLTRRQLQRRGPLGSAALLADQAALLEKDADTAEKIRHHSAGLKALAKPRNYIDYDLPGGGNVSLGNQYMTAVSERLLTHEGITIAERNAALATLLMIVTNLEWQSYKCSKSAMDLCAMLGVKKPNMANTLALLEEVGAIVRIKKGQTKIITVTPEGAFRGRIDQHGAAVAQYATEVVPLRRDRNPAPVSAA